MSVEATAAMWARRVDDIASMAAWAKVVVPAPWCNSKKGGRNPAEFGELLRKHAAIMATPCPRCGAESGVPCVDRHGHTRHGGAVQQHSERKFAMEYMRGGS